LLTPVGMKKVVDVVDVDVTVAVTVLGTPEIVVV
jgi:hypothetical protein